MSTVAARRSPTSHYRPPPRRRDLEPLPPRWVQPDVWLARPSMARFVLLSMLLHALFIVLFGAPPGGSRDGRAVWGSLNVVIQGARETPAPRPVERPPEVSEAPPRPAILDTPREAAAQDPIPTAPPAPQVFPQLLDRIVVERHDEPQPLLVPPPTDLQVAPAPVVAVPAPISRAERRTVDKPLLAAPQVMPAPPPRLAVPAPIIPSTEPRAVQTPLAPPPVLETAPPPSLSTPAPIPRIEAKPAEAPPLAAAPPVERAPAIEQPLARPIDKALVQDIAPPRTPTALERALTRPAEPALHAAPAIRPGSLPAPAAPAEGLATGPRDAPAYDPTKPATPVDLDAARRRAGQLAREGTGNRALLPFPMPPVDPAKTKMEKAIENARKPDCREHYKGLGLAAIVPLVANEFGEGSCRW